MRALTLSNNVSLLSRLDIAIFDTNQENNLVVRIIHVNCQDEAPPTADARTIGFWKNHDGLTGPLLDIGLGDTLVKDKDQAVKELKNSNARDAKNALRAQLLETVLNLKNGAAFDAAILDTVQDAKVFLNAHIGDEVGRKHADRQAAWT